MHTVGRLAWPFQFGQQFGQVVKALEITGAYMISDRTSSRYPYEQERDDVTRVQVQVNY